MKFGERALDLTFLEKHFGRQKRKRQLLISIYRYLYNSFIGSLVCQASTFLSLLQPTAIHSDVPQPDVMEKVGIIDITSQVLKLGAKFPVPLKNPIAISGGSSSLGCSFER